MSFATMNGVNAAKGLQGTERTQQATFAGLGAPLQSAPQGMGGPQMMAPQAAQGSSYTIGNGMQGTGRATLAGTQASALAGYNVADTANQQGVVAGHQQQANVGQPPPQMTQAQMQDPANAAMAGFQFAAGQDQAPSAPTNMVGPRPVDASAAGPTKPGQMGTQLAGSGAQLASVGGPKNASLLPPPNLQRMM